MTEASARRAPHWLVAAVVGLVSGGVGFVAKDGYERWIEEREKDRAQLESLERLSSLLEESYSIFQDQNYKARRLIEMLRRNHPSEFVERCSQGCGFDDAFFLMADLFTPEERELQQLIRSTTINSQRRVNEEMREWLKAERSFSGPHQPSVTREELARQLDTLRKHLNLWFDKYHAWIPNEPERSLVYLADEKKHGERFPTELGKTVRDVIASWQPERRQSNAGHRK